MNKQRATRDPHQVNDLFAFLINVLLIATSALQKHLHGISVDGHSDIDDAIFCDPVSQLFALLLGVLLVPTSVLQKPFHQDNVDDHGNIDDPYVCDRASQRPPAIGCGLFALAIAKHLSALLSEFAQCNRPR